ncbi:hypothetical protein QYF61_027307 [Mycteria americana]|uniref:Ubiquitin carboxyl-terminal hydrolase 4 n=1 Tax=Mycteria americana TaxID=33587 RepID=A0AAN7MI66_MYCAM|nr:hypothetical protein QYF61_027307 [Mycteria americana]
MARPVVWNFTPKQVQDPDEVIECLKKNRHGYSKEAQLTTLCWALASIYQTLLDIMQHPQGEERVSGSENVPTDTMAKPDTLSVAPISKKKQWKQKPTCLVRDEEASPKREQEKESEEADCSAAEQSQEQEEEETEIINETETTQSLHLSELRDMQKYFSRQPGKLILSCSQELEGKEARQLGSLAKDKTIDKGIGKRAGVLSLWRRLLSSVKDRYPFKEELANSQSKWTTIEGGIQYLRELAMVEVIYNLDDDQVSKDLDEIRCMGSMW